MLKNRMLNFLRSFGYAAKGIRFALAQRNFRVQLLCAILVCCFAFFFNVSSTEWCILLICIAFVLSLETMNSALEHFVDLVSPQRNDIAGKVKDLAAGAVLIASVIAALVAV